MSDILNAIHEDVTALHECGAVNEITMRNFDALCLTPVPTYTPERIKEVREKNHVSQSVLAAYLCVTVKAVQRWEQGSSKPSGDTAKLLAIAEKKGLQAIA
ncbi:helix-turn-helix domain-containing protein [Neptuniibacter marinus]|uniref:helix-turn-helix domain-containing protein n=1 Tax=Neptuniibacter marinus TaxID=1806670 RepID=UPI0008366985|nr:DNA-binding transcriptional regulator [Neptuniibacter marinus]